MHSSHRFNPSAKRLYQDNLETLSDYEVPQPLKRQKREVKWKRNDSVTRLLKYIEVLCGVPAQELVPADLQSGGGIKLDDPRQWSKTRVLHLLSLLNKVSGDIELARRLLRAASALSAAEEGVDYEQCDPATIRAAMDLYDCASPLLEHDSILSSVPGALYTSAPHASWALHDDETIQIYVQKQGSNAYSEGGVTLDTTNAINNSFSSEKGSEYCSEVNSRVFNEVFPGSKKQHSTLRAIFDCIS